MIFGTGSSIGTAVVLVLVLSMPPPVAPVTLGKHQGRARVECDSYGGVLLGVDRGLPGAGIAREARMGAAADLPAHTVVAAKRWAVELIGTVTSEGVCPAVLTWVSPSHTLVERPCASTSHRREKTSACPVSVETLSRAETGPRTSTGSASGGPVNVRTSSLASSALLSRGPAVRESRGPPSDGVGAAGS